MLVYSIVLQYDIYDQMAEPRVYETLKLDRVHIGEPAAAAVLLEMELRAVTRAVIVASNTLSRKTPVVNEVKAQLGDRCVGVFDATVEHASRETVISLADFLRRESADLVITMGGGTPIDTVKTALVCLAEGLTKKEELERFAIYVDEGGQRQTPKVGSPGIRQIAIPTTLSGAEFSDLAGCVNTDTQVKQLYSGQEIGPASVILDPSATLFTPMQLWLSAGIRAIDHAVETLYSTLQEPIAIGSALQGMRLLATSLPATASNSEDLTARLDSQIGVWLAASGVNRVPFGASHGIGHQLGAHGVAHGYTSCVMLPHVMTYNASVAENQLTQVPAILGRPDDSPSEAVAHLIASLGLPTRLRDVGIEKSQIAAIASAAADHPWVHSNPRPIESVDQIITILERAY